VTAHRIIENVDFGSGPPLLGHTLSETKPAADTILQASDAGPLLAHWHVGLGQVATFTSATTGGWADQWRGWDGFRALFTQAAWAIMRARTVEPVSVRIDPVPGRDDARRVTVLGPSVAMEPVPVVRLARSRTDGVLLEVSAAGPGVWSADVPLGRGLLVTAMLPGEPEPTAAVGEDAPYPIELATFGADRATLDTWADVGGGAVLDAPERIFDAPDPTEVPRSIRMALLIAALLFYLFSVLLLRLPDAAVAAPSIPAARPSRAPAAPVAAAPARKEAA
jgi:hypothetical protein